MNDGEMNEDDILQLLSRPSSANTNSSRRKSRKKVTFSNNVLDQGIDQSHPNFKSASLLSLSSSNRPTTSIFSTEEDISILNTIDNKEEDIILPSFSRSKRVDESYSTDRLNDISDLLLLKEKKQDDDKKDKHSVQNTMDSRNHYALDSKPKMITSTLTAQQDINDLEEHASNRMNTDHGQTSESSKLRQDDTQNTNKDKNLKQFRASTNVEEARTYNGVDHNHNKKQDVNINIALQSITEQLKQNMDTLQLLENKIDASKCDTEEKLLKRNDWLREKLEQSIDGLKHQHQGDSNALQSTAQSIYEYMESMLHQFKVENEKLSKKQEELTKLQNILVEERRATKVMLDSERELQKHVSLQNKNDYDDNTKEKYNLDQFKKSLDQREADLSSKEKEHRYMMMKEQQELELLKKKVNIDQENLQSKLKDLTERNLLLIKQSESQNLMSNKLDQERMKLQNMAEHLSKISTDLVIKSQSVDENLCRIENVNSNIESTKSMIVNERVSLQHDRSNFISCIEEMHVMKMDIVRQRVEYLKEKTNNL